MQHANTDSSVSETARPTRQARILTAIGIAVASGLVAYFAGRRQGADRLSAHFCQRVDHRIVRHVVLGGHDERGDAPAVIGLLGEMHDAGADADTIKAVQELIDEKRFPIRVYVMDTTARPSFLSSTVMPSPGPDGTRKRPFCRLGASSASDVSL